MRDFGDRVSPCLPTLSIYLLSSKSWSSSACVYVCVCVNRCVCVCRCANVKLISCTDGRASELQIFTVSMLLSLASSGVQMTTAPTDLCVGAGGPNSGLYARMQGTLTTELSPQPSNPSIRISKMQRIPIDDP